MSDPATLRLAEPLVDGVMGAFRNLFPEKLKTVEESYSDDFIELTLPADGAYLPGIRSRAMLPSVPAVMFDVPSGDMLEGTETVSGAESGVWETNASILVWFCVEHPDIEKLPRIMWRYVRAGQLVFLDYESNGLAELGYAPLAFAQDYMPTLYNEAENLYGRDAHLIAKIYSMEG